MKNKRLIPAQRIIGSNKELFIIKYEGSVIEIHRTNNLYEPLIVQLNGVIIDSIPSKQKKEIAFSLEDGSTHKLEVWNERINNSPLIKVLGKDGIAIVIDGVPVQNSLADPLGGLSKPKFFLWLLTAFLFFLSIALPIIRIQNGYTFKLSIILFAYIFLFILSLYAVLTFQTNPIKSIWIGIILIVLESSYSSYFIVSTVGFNIGSIGFLILRLIILSSLIFSLKTLKSLLDINEVGKTENELNEVKTNNAKRRKIFTIKNSLIFSAIIVISVGLYFGVGALISYINEPSLERDNAIVFRTDLKLPELIPYRKGEKWGYANKKGEIVIKPIYSKVEFFSENKFLRVEEDTLVGIIDNQGNNLIPCFYKNIDEIQNDSLFINENSVGKYGVIDDKNNIVIPFVYEELKKHSNRDLYIAKKGEIGVIDGNNNTIIPFIYENNIIIDPSIPVLSSISGLELCDDFIIVRKKVGEKLYSAIFDFNGSILFNFVKAVFTRKFVYLSDLGFMDGRNLDDDLLIFSIEKQNIYNPKSGYFEPTRFCGIIDKTGNIILPPEYKSIYTYPSSSKKYSTIGKLNYRTDSYVI